MFHVKQRRASRRLAALLAEMEPADQPRVAVNACRRSGPGTSPTRRNSGRFGRTDAGLWLDLGSGAGFPGLVVAILAAECAPAMAVRWSRATSARPPSCRPSPGRPALRSTCSPTRIERLAATAGRRRVGPGPRAAGRPARHAWKNTAGPGVLGCFPRARRCITRSPMRRRAGASTASSSPAGPIPGQRFVEIGATERV